MYKKYIDEKEINEFDSAQATWVESLSICDQYRFLYFKASLFKWRVDRFVLFHPELYSIKYVVDYVPSKRFCFNAVVTYELPND